jgi:hypothetical protein
MEPHQQEPEGEPPPPKGGLGILFLAAALALFAFLSAIGLFAYFAMR